MLSTRTLPRWLLLISLLALATAPTTPSLAAPTTEINYAALDAYITAQMEKHWLPGVALAVVRGNEMVYAKGYGVDGTGTAITPQTRMFIGSQSKSFTALAIAQLMEAGKLKLDDPVRAHISWFAVADEAASAQITINHLLHHTSGLSESGFGQVLPDEATPEMATRALAQARPTAPIGEQHQYFNLGYDVLAYLVEIISGQSYPNYIAEHILQPLGMARSTADLQNLAEMPHGFNRYFGFPVPTRQHIPVYEIGAGYIVSTAEDLARYALAMKNAATGKSNFLVSPATARAIFQPGIGTYGLGWYISKEAGTRHIFHGGANDTFNTHVDLYPERDLAIVLLINVGHQTDHFISAAQTFAGIQAIVLGRTPPPVEQDWSVTWLGWGLGVMVLGLLALHIRNFLVLRGWAERARHMTPARRAWAVAISFIIPTAILVVIAYQLSGFWSHRFHPYSTFIMLPTVMPDMAILMLMGTLPDYVQGFLKLYWVMRDMKPAQSAASLATPQTLASNK